MNIYICICVLIIDLYIIVYVIYNLYTIYSSHIKLLTMGTPCKRDKLIITIKAELSKQHYVYNVQ